MAGKRAWVAVLGLAGTVAWAGGCATQTGLTNPLTGTPIAEAPRKDDLPHDQAVQASLAAARALDKAGNESAAIPHYEKVAKLDPANLTVSRRLAVLYDRCGDFDKADAQYGKLAKVLPRDADLFNDWGYSYYERTKWPEAEKHLRHALELDPHHSRARDNLGLVLGQQGKYAEALAAFQAVVGEADAHCNLAFVYWSQGNLDAARAEVRQAALLDPANTNAQKILAQLDRPAQAPPTGVASAAAPHRTADRTAAAREAYRQEALAAAAKLEAPGSAGPAPEGPTPKPVYQSPNGTMWIPVTPAPKPAAPKDPAAETTGTITWE
jgi:Tfp pilus assembly protein PilF